MHLSLSGLLSEYKYKLRGIYMILFLQGEGTKIAEKCAGEVEGNMDK